jgi:hypothetical protein
VQCGDQVGASADVGPGVVAESGDEPGVICREDQIGQRSAAAHVTGPPGEGLFGTGFDQQIGPVPVKGQLRSEGEDDLFGRGRDREPTKVAVLEAVAVPAVTTQCFRPDGMSRRARSRLGVPARSRAR